jgi:hypothetical protein
VYQRIRISRYLVPKAKLIFLLNMINLFLAACGSGQLFGPTVTPTPTITPQPTNTPRPSAISTPLSGLGITDSELVAWAEDLEYAFTEITLDGLPARKYVSPEGYTVLTLVGEPPYVQKVILEIDVENEDSFTATSTWIYVLEVSSNYAGEPAIDWVHDTLPKAVQSGREEKVFKDANVVLEVEGNTFRLIIEPAVK